MISFSRSGRKRKVTSKRIDIGSAFVVMAPWEQPLEPRPRQYGLLSGKRRRSNARDYSLAPAEHKVPGEREWYKLRRRQAVQSWVGKKSRRDGIPDGYTKKTAAPMKAKAKREAIAIVNAIMDNYENAHPLAKEALELFATQMREDGDADRKARAATKILEYLMAKPANRQQVVLGHAEALFESIDPDEDIFLEPTPKRLLAERKDAQ